MEMFFAGVAVTVAAALLIKMFQGVKMLEPIHMVRLPEPSWRAQQYGSNPPAPVADKPPPPPGPPGRTIHDLHGETKQSIRDREDYETYMAGFTHGTAVVRSNAGVKPVRPTEIGSELQ